MKVLRRFQNLSQGKGLGLKMFHDIEMREEKLEALCEAFQTGMPILDQSKLSRLRFKKDKTGSYILNLEIDILGPML
jgi:hypothetical protein